MIILTFETVDETGQEKRGAHNHDIEVELEQDCRDGLCQRNHWDVTNPYRKYLTIDEYCPVCHGTGLIPSENGLKILKFIEKYSKVKEV